MGYTEVPEPVEKYKSLTLFHIPQTTSVSSDHAWAGIDADILITVLR